MVRAGSKDVRAAMARFSGRRRGIAASFDAVFQAAGASPTANTVAASPLAGHQANPIFERDRISAIDVEIADAQALAAPPDLESRVNSRPVPGRLDPPTGLGGAEERVEPQTFYAADLGSVDEDDQTP